jgi:hypothetical protein
MGTIFKLGTIAAFLNFVPTSPVLADDFWICPPVPEFDASSGVAVIALLMSVGAVLLRRARG